MDDRIAVKFSHCLLHVIHKERKGISHILRCDRISPFREDEELGKEPFGFRCLQRRALNMDGISPGDNIDIERPLDGLYMFIELAEYIARVFRRYLDGKVNVTCH